LTAHRSRKHPIHQHPPAFRHIQALNQLRQRALAGTGTADDADDLAGRDHEAPPEVSGCPADMLITIFFEG